MFWRLLLLLLIALNVGVAGWLAFGRAPHPTPPLTDPGVPELKLLSPQPSASDFPAAHAIRASGKCLRLGPFTTQSGMHQAFNALLPRVPQIQFHHDDVTRSTGWWVYLPAFSTQEEALATARSLADKGVRDYYVITAGDRQNTVSLGLFHNEENARHRFARIAKLGFKPKLTQRTETLPEYWVDIALPAKPGFDWHDWVKAAAINAAAINCF